MDHRLRMLLEGKVGQVIGGLRRMLTRHALSDRSAACCKARFATMRTIGIRCATTTTSRPAIRSAAESWKGPAATWSRTGWNTPGCVGRSPARAILNLRAVYLNDDWNDFVSYRIETEQTARIREMCGVAECESHPNNFVIVYRLVLRGRRIRRGAAQSFEEESEAKEGSLFAGADLRRSECFAIGAVPGAVAAPDFAVHDSRANGLFAPIIRGVDRGIDQNQNQCKECLRRCPAKRRFAWAREAAAGQLFQFTGQAQAAFGQVVAAQPMAPPGAAQGIRPVDQPEHRAGQATRRRPRRFPRVPRTAAASVCRHC